MARTVVMDEVAGDIVTAAMKFVVTASRQKDIEEMVRRYGSSDARNQASFMDVYGEGAKASVARQAIANIWVMFPERHLGVWSPERVIISHDSNPRRKPGTRQVVGQVLLRANDGLGFRTRTWRIHVHIDYLIRDDRSVLKDKVELIPCAPVDHVIPAPK